VQRCTRRRRDSIPAAPPRRRPKRWKRPSRRVRSRRMRICSMRLVSFGRVWGVRRERESRDRAASGDENENGGDRTESDERGEQHVLGFGGVRLSHERLFLPCSRPLYDEGPIPQGTGPS